MNSTRRLFSIALSALVLVSLVVVLVQMVTRDDPVQPAGNSPVATATATTHPPATDTPSSEPNITRSQSRLVALYFHATQRCVTCEKIEQLAQETILTSFRDEIEDGRIEFQIINVEPAENRHFIQDYQLQFPSLIIAQFDGDQQVRWKNLTRVWQLAYDNEGYASYVRQEIHNMLEETE